MNTTLVRKCLLIMVLCIIPVSAGVGLIFTPATMGYSLPVAIYVLPLICILGGVILVLLFKRRGNRKGYLLGILSSTILWLSLCWLLLMVPTDLRYLFRYTVPGLERYLLEREGKSIAHAVNGRYVNSDIAGSVSRINLEGWQTLDAGTDLENLVLWGHFKDPFPLHDTLKVVQDISKLINPFLNDPGRKVLIAGRNNRQLIPGGFNFSVYDDDERAFTVDVRSNYIIVVIDEKYSVLE